MHTISPPLVRRVSVMLFAILGLLFLTVRLSHAKDYRIKADGNPVHIYQSGYGANIIIESLVVDTLGIEVSFVGDTSLTLGWDSRYKMENGVLKIHEIGGVSMVYVWVSFRSGDEDLHTGTLFIGDSHDRDTIRIEAQDTMKKWMSEGNIKIINSHPWQFNPGGADSVDLQLRIRNDGTKEALASVRLSSVCDATSYALIGPSQFTLAANQVDSTLIRFYNHGQNSPCRAIAMLYNGNMFKDSLMIETVGNPQPTYRAPKVEFKNFKAVAAGDVERHTVTLTNPNPQDMTIGLRVSETATYAIEGLTLPATIPGYGSLSFTARFTAPQTPDRANPYYGNFDIGWEVSSHSEGFHFVMTAWVDPCFTLEPDGLEFEPTVIDGWVDADMKIVNHTSSSLSLRSFFHSENGPMYFANKRIYVDLEPNETKTVTVRVIPKFAGPISGYMSLQPDSIGSCAYYVSEPFTGKAVIDNSDSVGLDLLPKQKETLILHGKPNPAHKLFTFTNNTASSIKVVSVSLASGTHFSLSSVTPSAPPLTLASNATMTVDLAFDADTNGQYRDSLIVVTDNALTSLVFSIQGLQESALQTASVETRPVSIAKLAITPNPARGAVNIRTSNARSASLDVLDVLGNVIYSAKDLSARWNTEALSNGTYIVRVTGVDATGTPFTQSQRLILQK